MMTTVTVLDIIKAAERAINALAVEDDVMSPEANEAFTLLNGMVDEWNNQRFACYQITTEQWPVTSGQYVYTIGESATADWNTERPVEIDSLFVRDSTQANNVVDYPVKLVNNEQYQTIALKASTTTYPAVALYVASWPLASLTFYPVPTINLTAILSRWSQFTSFTSMTQTVSFPPGYYMALVYGLAQLLPSLGHNPPNAVMARVDALADRYMASIKRVNAKEPLIASLDPVLTGRMIGYPNIYTG